MPTFDSIRMKMWVGNAAEFVAKSGDCCNESELFKKKCPSVLKSNHVSIHCSEQTQIHTEGWAKEPQRRIYSSQ